MPMVTRIVIATVVVLAGCDEVAQTNNDAPRSASPEACNAAAYAGLIGQDAVVALQIPEPKRSYRTDVVTTDYRPDRVNIVSDETDTIIDIKCG